MRDFRLAGRAARNRPRGRANRASPQGIQRRRAHPLWRHAADPGRNSRTDGCDQGRGPGGPDLVDRRGRSPGDRGSRRGRFHRTRRRSNRRHTRRIGDPRAQHGGLSALGRVALENAGPGRRPQRAGRDLPHRPGGPIGARRTAGRSAADGGSRRSHRRQYEGRTRAGRRGDSPSKVGSADARWCHRHRSGGDLHRRGRRNRKRHRARAGLFDPGRKPHRRRRAPQTRLHDRMCELATSSRSRTAYSATE